MTDFLELAVRDGHALSGKSLAELETVIERGQQTFIEVGRALLEIRDGRLYRASYTTFEAYCRERWGWSQQHAHRQMDAARVAELVSPIGEVPANENQARAMLNRLDPAEREQVRRGEAAPEVVERMVAPPEKWQGDKGVLITTGESDWLTPPHIVTAAEQALGGIDVDPCASLTYCDNVPAKFKWTVSDNGLSRPWHGTVYMNPPYGRPIGDWTSKLAAESAAGRVTAYVALVPARTDTKWFADFADCLYCFIRGRISFGNLDQGAPFPSVAVYFGPHPTQFADVFGEYGLVLGKWPV